MNPKRAAAAGYRFSVIPAGAITDPDVTPRDLQVLCLLGRHTDNQGWCTRSQVRMADELHCARSTIQKALDRLETVGYVQRKLIGRPNAAPNPDKQPFSSYMYRVILDVEGGAGISAPHENSPVTGEGVPTDRQGVPIQIGTGCRPESAPLEHTPLEHTPSQPAQARERDAVEHHAHELIIQFPDIWKAFMAVPGSSPLMSEVKACEALQRLIDHGEALPSPADMIAAIGVYAAEVSAINAKRRSPIFIQHPHTWFTEKRWQQYAGAAREAHMARQGLAVRACNAAAGLGETGFERLKIAGISPAEIEAWFTGCVGEGEDGAPVIRAPSQFKAVEIEKRFGARLRKDEAFGAGLKIIDVKERRAAA